MRKYLETMNVDPLAIEAHEKGERETDTIHTITLTRTQVKIVKRSRVNNDVTVELEIGKESVQHLPPGDRPKKTIASSGSTGYLEIRSSLLTLNGMASVVDIRSLLQEDEGQKSVMKQELTIKNEQSGVSHTTYRHFVPYLETPPHFVDEQK